MSYLAGMDKQVKFAVKKGSRKKKRGSTTKCGLRAGRGTDTEYGVHADSSIRGPAGFNRLISRSPREEQN